MTLYEEKTEIPSDDDAEVLARIRAELHDSDEETRWIMRAYRASTSRGGKEAWLFDIEPQELETITQKLRDEYGSGTYCVRIYKNSKLVPGGVRLFAVERPPSSTPQAPIGAQPGPDRIELMLERQSQLIERLLTQNTNPRDPYADMQKLSEVMKNLRGDTPAPVAASDGMTVEKVVSLIQLGKDLAGESGGGDGETGIMDIIKTVAEKLPLGDMLAAMQQVTPQRPAPQRMPPQRFIPSTPASDPVTPPPVPDFVQQVGAKLDQLLRAAERNSSPELHAELLWDEWPDALPELLKQPDLFAQFQALRPQVGAYRAWFVDLIDLARRMGEDDGSQSDELAEHGLAANGGNGHSAGPSGNPRDAKNNAPPDTRGAEKSSHPFGGGGFNF